MRSIIILGVVLLFCSCNSRKIPLECTTVIGQLLFSNSEIQFGEVGVGKIGFGTLKICNPTNKEVRVRLFNRLAELHLIKFEECAVKNDDEEFVLQSFETKLCHFEFVTSDTLMIGSYLKNIFFEINGELHLKPIEIKVVICEKRDSLNLRELKESPIIRLEYDTLSFGVIKGNLPVVKVINIKNCGNRDLIIRKIETDCTCTASIIEKRVIASNMSAPLEIMLKPMGRKGKQNRTITIFSNDVMKPVVKVPLQGYVE